MVGAGTGTAAAVPGSSRSATTCQGQPATIEGNSATLLGTPGNDVIVAGGDVHHVVAGDGDDLICVVDDRRKRLEVLAGPGADVVDTTAATGHTIARMGTGTDTLVGGAELDEVYLDREPVEPATPDVVRTGGGGDLLFSESAVDADLGPGDDFYVGEFTAGQGSSRLRLGQGSDVLRLDMGLVESRLRLDLRAGTLVQGGVPSAVAGAERVIANGPVVWVRGTHRADDVVSGGCDVTMRGGGGHDELTQVTGYDVACAKRRARLYGEGGPDELRASAGNDVLVGGSGKDRAYGGPGRDRCLAERTDGCE